MTYLETLNEMKKKLEAELKVYKREHDNAEAMVEECGAKLIYADRAKASDDIIEECEANYDIAEVKERKCYDRMDAADDLLYLIKDAIDAAEGLARVLGN